MNPLNKQDIVELVDMSHNLKANTNISIDNPVSLWRSTEQYHDRALLTNIYWFDGTIADLSRMQSLVDRASLYTSLNVDEDMQSMERALGDRALFFGFTTSFLHKEEKGDHFLPVGNTTAGVQMYYYNGSNIRLTGVPEGAKSMIILIGSDDLWTVIVGMNYIAHDHGVEIYYNKVKSDGSIDTLYREKVISTPLLKRYTTNSTEWHYKTASGYITPRATWPTTVFSVLESPLVTSSSMTKPISSVKFVPSEKNKDQWTYLVAANKMKNTVTLGSLLSHDNKITKNDRLSRIPVSVVKDFIDSMGLAFSDIASYEVELHYDFPEYDALVEIPWEYRNDEEYTEVDYGFVRVKSEQAKIVAPGVLQVQNRPMAGWVNQRHFVYIYIYSSVTDGYVKYALVPEGKTLKTGVTGVTEINDFDIDYHNGTISIGKEYITYSNSDIIYIDYTYYASHVPYSGFKAIRSGMGLLDWHLDTNPRIGHVMTWEAEKEELEYMYGTAGTTWKFSGYWIYGTPTVYKVNSTTDELDEIDSSTYFIDKRKGVLTFMSNAPSPTDTLVADYIARSTASAKLFHSTAHIYATPSTVIFRNEHDQIAYAFNIATAEEGTIQHTFDHTVFDAQHENYDPSKILLTKVRLVAPICMSDIESFDTRERGGGIDYGLHAWDVTGMDGKILSGSGALLIRIPYEITQSLRAGEINEKDIRNIIERHIAAGTVYIIQYESEFGEYNENY
jgi:hypothetical protein